jgi:hypothetical protein
MLWTSLNILEPSWPTVWTEREKDGEWRRCGDAELRCASWKHRGTAFPPSTLSSSSVHMHTASRTTQNSDSIRFQIFQWELWVIALRLHHHLLSAFNIFQAQILSLCWDQVQQIALKGHEGPWRAQLIQTSPSGFPDDLVNPLIPVPLESELKHADRSDRSDRSDRHWQTLTGAKRRSCGAIQKCDALCRVCAEFSG